MFKNTSSEDLFSAIWPTLRILIFLFYDIKKRQIVRYLNIWSSWPLTFFFTIIDLAFELTTHCCAKRKIKYGSVDICVCHCGGTKNCLKCNSSKTWCVDKNAANSFKNCWLLHFVEFNYVELDEMKDLFQIDFWRSPHLV